METATWNCAELDHVRDIETTTDGLVSTYRRVGACYECGAMDLDALATKSFSETDLPLDFVYNEIQNHLLATLPNEDQFVEVVENDAEIDAETAEFILNEILGLYRSGWYADWGL